MGRPSEQVRAPLTLNPLGDSGLVTESEPTPVFRRFPWIQLVFCLACLSVAAWVWMRYSYAWDVTNIPSDTWGEGLYVECSGERLVLAEHFRSDFIAGGADGTRPLAFLHCNLSGVLFVGRVKGRAITDYDEYTVRFVRPVPFLDTTASRLHPASVSGLVVGAMGCFIFGLYLRRWLRERKALVSQPGQDMIA